MIRLCTLFVAVALANGCDNADAPTSPPVGVPAEVAVNPATVELDALGATVKLTAEVMDQNEQVMTGATLTWSSGDTTVATVDAAGLVTVAGNGEARVTASAGSASGATLILASAASSAGVCDRTPQVRDAIMEGAGKSDCAAVTSADLASITSLDLAGPRKAINSLDACRESFGREIPAHKEEMIRSVCGLASQVGSADQSAANSAGGPEIHALKDGDFEGLSGLADLYLRDNWLVELPGDLLDPLDSLVSLDLCRNILLELPDGVFDSLTQLQSIRVSGNGLTELPAGLLNAHSELEVVSFSGNRLVELPEGFLSASRKLRSAWFSSNELSELPAGFLGSHPELEDVSDSRNALTELPEGFLDGSRKLEYASFSHNELTELPRGLLGAHPELTDVSFWDNQITELPEGMFDASRGLESVDFDDNRLEELPAELLGEQPNLRSMFLERNRILALPDGFFEGWSSLRRAYFGGNPGSPFTVDLLPERHDNSDPLAPGPATLRVDAPEAAPFSIDISLTGLGNAAPSSDTVRIEAGDTLSSEATVTIQGGGAGVQIDAATVECDGCRYRGLRLATGALITLANPREATIKIAAAYITQAAQNLDGTVPLVAGRDALLRVFATSDLVNSYGISGMAVVEDGRGNVLVQDMVPPEGGIGLEVEEGRLGSSFNLPLQGRWLAPGSKVSIQLIPGRGCQPDRRERTGDRAHPGGAECGTARGQDRAHSVWMA